MLKTKGQALFGAAALAFAAAGTLTAPTPAVACGSEAYLGAVCWFGFDYCPQDTVPANGAILQIRGNDALFSLLGAKFGGDGRTTFAVPDLRGRSAVGTGPGVGLARVSIGEMRGTENVTMTVAQMPAHTHVATVTQTGGGGGSALAVSVAIPVVANADATTNTPGTTMNLARTTGKLARDAVTVNAFSDAATTTTLKPFAATVTGGSSGGSVAVSNSLVGGSQSQPNLPPQLGLTACIVTTGLYPVRP